MHRRSRVWCVLLLAVTGCSSTPSAVPDAGAPAIDAPVAQRCASSAGDPIYLGLLPADGGCRACNSTYRDESPDDPACQSEYAGVLPAGCRAYCRDSQCLRLCPDQCRLPPAGGGCHPGDRACTLQGITMVCDPTCGATGGCRTCVYNRECEAELGQGAICQRHCGNCCDPRATSTADGGIPCLCT